MRQAIMVADLRSEKAVVEGFQRAVDEVFNDGTLARLAREPYATEVRMLIWNPSQPQIGLVGAVVSAQGRVSLYVRVTARQSYRIVPPGIASRLTVTLAVAGRASQVGYSARDRMYAVEVFGPYSEIRRQPKAVIGLA